MARGDVPITDIKRTGVAPPTAVTGDPTNDHKIAYNDGRIFLECVNSAGASGTVTIITPGVVDEQVVEDRVVTVPANATRLIGPFQPAIYNQPDGTVEIDVSATTIALRAYHVAG